MEQQRKGVSQSHEAGSSLLRIIRPKKMDRGRGRFPRRVGGGGHLWIGGKRSPPDEWMDQDDLLMEGDLREKLHHEQEQKRRIQEKQQGVP